MIIFDHVSKVYPNGTVGLDDVDLTIQDGEFVAIIGRSGAGKSTLLRSVNRMHQITSGTLTVNGTDVSTLSGKSLRRFRRGIGMVFQSFNLVTRTTVIKNVLSACVPDMPFWRVLLGAFRKEDKIKALESLDKVGILDKAYIRADQLSGGQQQRVAIARALATDPKVLLCDEATSALDPKTTRQILELIQDINRKLGITVVVITHQMSVVKEICTHVAILDDGEVVEDGLVSAVFSAPKSQAARHLVFPGGADAAVSDPSQERRIRLIFRSAQTTAIPMVARLAAEESIYANVISASTQKLSEEVYGSMLLGIPNSQFDRAWQFFRTIPNLQAEEVSVDVQ